MRMVTRALSSNAVPRRSVSGGNAVGAPHNKQNKAQHGAEL